MSSGFYRHFDVMGGLGYDGSAYHQFGFPLSGAFDAADDAVPGGIDRIHALSVAPDNTNKAYAYAVDPTDGNTWLYRSTDGGLTWTRISLFPGRAAGNWPDSNQLTTHSGGELFLANRTDNNFTSRKDGVWRSTDDGGTWTRIANCEGSLTSYQVPTGGSANNQVVSVAGPGGTSYGIIGPGIAPPTILEFNWTLSGSGADGTHWTAQFYDAGGTTAIGSSYTLASGSSGHFLISDYTSLFTAGARLMRFSTGLAETIQGPMSTYHGGTGGSFPFSLSVTAGCGSTCIGSSKVWFAWEVTGHFYTSPYPTTLITQGTDLYRVEQANLDGSARTTLGEITQYANSNYNATHTRRELPLRAWGDAFVLIPASRAQPNSSGGAAISRLWRVDSGGVSVIGIPSGTLLDAVPLSATTWLALIAVVSTVYIYRSTDAGTVWTVQHTLTGPDFYPQAAADTFGGWQIAPIPGTTDIFVNGDHGDGPAGPDTTQLVTWYSSDLGVTWTGIYEPTPPAPVNDTGGWMNGQQLGICPGAPFLPPPVAAGVSQVSIVG